MFPVFLNFSFVDVYVLCFCIKPEANCFMFFLVFLFHFADDGQDKASDDAPENNPQYTTVYVGNLAHEARISSLYRNLKISSVIK